MKKKTPSKKSKAQIRGKYDVIELPSDNVDMEKYVEKNRAEINEKIVDNIEYALKNRLTGVELFCFKDSNFVVVLHRKDFKENLQHVFEFSLENEQFEVCEKARRVLDRLEKTCYIFTYNRKK